MGGPQSQGSWNATKVLIGLERRIRPLLARPFVLHAFGSLRRMVERLGFADLTVERDGLRITGGISDRNMLASVEAKTFEPFTLSQWESMIEPGSVVIDVGAHVGIFTLLASAAVGPQGRVWAIEPNPTSLRLLAHNVKSNALDNVTVLNAALSDENGTSTLHVRPGDRMQSSLVAVEAGSELDVAVRVARLDDLLPRDVRVDVLKVDAEGSEPAILRGMTRLLPGVRALIVESNPNCLRQAGSSPTELHSMLVDAGFDVFVIDEETKRLIPCPAAGLSTILDDRFINLLAKRQASGPGAEDGPGAP